MAEKMKKFFNQGRNSESKSEFHDIPAEQYDWNQFPQVDIETPLIVNGGWWEDYRCSD